jgi:hypothetical protein
MVVYGVAEEKAMVGEKKLVIEEDGRIKVEYHSTEPVMRSMKKTEKLGQMMYW